MFMTHSIVILFLALLCILLFYFVYNFMSDKTKACIIFFGIIFMILVISSILIAIGIEPFLFT